jgi:hypothetical protein
MVLSIMFSHRRNADDDDDYYHPYSGIYKLGYTMYPPSVETECFFPYFFTRSFINISAISTVLSKEV